VKTSSVKARNQRGTHPFVRLSLVPLLALSPLALQQSVAQSNNQSASQPDTQPSAQPGTQAVAQPDAQPVAQAFAQPLPHSRMRGLLLSKHDHVVTPHSGAICRTRRTSAMWFPAASRCT
jgi:hypothetical protein